MLALVVPSTLRSLLRENENVFLLAARARVEPDFLVGDVFLHPGAPTRVLAEWIAGQWVAVMPLVPATLCLRVLIYAAFAAGLVGVVRRLNLNPWLVASILVVMVRFPSFVAGEWIVGGIEAKAMAYPAVLFGLAAALRNRWAWTGCWLGLATSLHLLVGAWSSLAILGALGWRSVGWRQAAKAAVAWLLAAGFAVFAVFAVAAAPPATPGFDAAHLVVHFRNPHHLVLSWGPATWVAMLPVLVGVIAMVMVLRSARAPDSERRVARFALLVIAPFIVGLGVSWLSDGTAFLRLYPFRGEALFLLLSALVAASGLGRLLPRVWLLRGSVATACALAVVLAVRVVPNQLRTFDPQLGALPGQTGNAAAWQWVREHSPADAIVLCAPDNGQARHFMQRAVVVTFKGLPADARGLERWYERLVAMNGGVAPTRRGFDALAEVARGFRERADYLELGRRFGCTYAVVPRARSAGLELLFRSGELAVCRLPP